MWKKDAIEYFDSQAEIARICKLSRQAVGIWGAVVPYGSARTLHRQSAGEIPLHEEHYTPSGRIIRQEESA